MDIVGRRLPVDVNCLCVLTACIFLRTSGLLLNCVNMFVLSASSVLHRTSWTPWSGRKAELKQVSPLTACCTYGPRAVTL